MNNLCNGHGLCNTTSGQCVCNVGSYGPQCESKESLIVLIILTLKFILIVYSLITFWKGTFAANNASVSHFSFKSRASQVFLLNISYLFIFKTNIVLEMKPATEKEPAMSNLENVFASLSILETPVKVSFCNKVDHLYVLTNFK